MADHPLRSATDRRLGEPLPHQLANQTRAHLSPINLWLVYYALFQLYEVLIKVSFGYPSVKGRLPTRYSPVRRLVLLRIQYSTLLALNSACFVSSNLTTRVRNEKTLIEYSIPSKPSLDLHVLGTPPAFILSQDQTLILIVYHRLYASNICLICSNALRFCLFPLFLELSETFKSFLPIFFRLYLVF